MKAAGYATAICGKWHLGGRADTSGPPQHHGFDFTSCVGHPYLDGGVEHWPSHVFAAGVRARRNAGTAHQEVTVTAS